MTSVSVWLTNHVVTGLQGGAQFFVVSMMPLCTSATAWRGWRHPRVPWLKCGWALCMAGRRALAQRCGRCRWRRPSAQAVTCSSSSATRAVLRARAAGRLGVPLRDASRLAGVHCHAAGVIAAVFGPLQACTRNGNDVARGYRADDTAHGWMPPIKPMRRMVGRRRRNMQLIFNEEVKFNFYIHPR